MDLNLLENKNDYDRMRWVENNPGLFKCQSSGWVWPLCKYCLAFPRSRRDEVPDILVGELVVHSCSSFFQSSGLHPLFPAGKALVKTAQRLWVQGTAWGWKTEQPCCSDLIKAMDYIFIDSALLPWHKIRLFAALLLVEVLGVYSTRRRCCGQKTEGKLWVEVNLC